MTESQLIQVDNETLQREYALFKGISAKFSTDHHLRTMYLHEMKKIFEASDKQHDGKIDRNEFETLIKGYFELKGIQRTQENFDSYFEKLDLKHEHCITLDEFIKFMDAVNDNDIIPFLTEEMQNRELL